jgi:ABC-type sugar transport system ATPase subunit
MEERVNRPLPEGSPATSPGSPSPGTPPFLRLEGISKRFGGVRALEDITLEIERGTVHALVGENGAGKSTLGKIIAGALQRDAGQMYLAGSEVHFSSPRQGLQAGVAILAQELALEPDATVAENVFLGAEPRRATVLRRGSLRRNFAAVLAESGFTGLRPDVPVRTLTVADQQKVEILRAMARRAETIIMDEPTARLSADEAEHLAEAIAGLRDRGTTIVYVSHFLKEVLAVSDRVTVLRDGKLVETLDSDATDVDGLAERMVGRAVLFQRPPADERPAGLDEPPVLSVKGLTRSDAFEDVTFDLHHGEILALTGLVGAGRSEVVHAIFGSAPADSGEISLAGEPIRNRKPADGIRHGIALLPESRKDEGLVMSASVTENISATALSRVSAAGVLRRGREARRAAGIAAEVGLAPRVLNSGVSALSGGNQQKVLFARWLNTDPTIFIADEPTRGVDVGAKEGIYEVLRAIARRGGGVILVSSEIEEVMALADRVLVMRVGRVVAEFANNEIAEDPITRAALGAGGSGRKEQ